jgi:FHS family L-fucose permease-like MFS transporter
MTKHVAPSKLLALFAASAAECTIIAVVGTGTAAVWGVVLLGFFDSVMFPTILALSVKGLGPTTKLGSPLLVMSIVGGALVPRHGRVSAASSITESVSGSVDFATPTCFFSQLEDIGPRYQPVRADQSLSITG